MTTKKRVLPEALKLFSQYGYKAVSVEHIEAVGMNSGIFNNPFLVLGKYTVEGEKALLPISFQFHHTQMDGARAGRFLKNLSDEIENLR